MRVIMCLVITKLGFMNCKIGCCRIGGNTVSKCKYVHDTMPSNTRPSIVPAAPSARTKFDVDVIFTVFIGTRIPLVH